MSNVKKIEERVLGHILSQEEMAQVSGGDGVPTSPPFVCTPANDKIKTPKPPKGVN
ncbi:MAG TPA: hypothetical protein VGH80_04480 [Xanthomonadaceae bacterium]|jgi:bacteriocin-like protein